MRRAAVYCDIRIALHELMDIDGVAVIRIYILSDALDKAGDVRRTAGAIEHLDALGYRQADFIAAPIFYPAVQKIYRQRIFIEEALSVERSAREEAVIDDPLHDIGIARINGGQRHTLGEHRERYSGAGLRIGGLVGQVAVNGECLSDAGRADTARDIHAVLRHIFEYSVRRREQFFVAALVGDISHRAVEIAGSDAVTDRFALVAQGDSVLEIILGSKSARFSPVLFVVAALIYKEAAEIEPALFARAAIEAHEGKFYLGMPGSRESRGIVPAENIIYKSGIAAHQVKKSALARGFIVGDRRFDKMSGAV